jgi:hypothetical protein
MALAALNYALNGGGNAIWLVLLHDAGHNILGIPWWVWLGLGVAATALAVAAAPELLLFAPEALEAADLAAMEAGEAAMDASLAEQGVSEAVAQQIAKGSAIQEGELGEAVANAIREGNYAANRAFIDSYNASLAEQAIASRIAAAVGPAAIFLGATEIPDVVSDVAGQVKQVGSAVQGPNSSSGSGTVSGNANPDAPAGTTSPPPSDGVNAGDPG